MAELLVVLAIASLLMAMGVPGLAGMIRNQRLTTSVNDFFAAINLTRSEAVQRGIRVDLVPAGDGTDWSKGWIVLVDRNANHKVDAGEQIIFSRGPVADGIAISQGFGNSTVQYLAYNAAGRTRTNASSHQPRPGYWLFETDGRRRKVVVNFLGRPRTCDPDADPAAC
ncbi:MAG: putative Tfp pilus assembly protein FimT [Herminiimonas sp.]|nr:putative Tfp pilus assembly protein FimT [Herminiimonas sp.]